MPPRPPPPGHHRPPPPGPPLEQADEDLPPIVLLDSDVQPRRTLRPSYPNPWAAEGVNWQGRQLSSGFFSPLSADAKFSREMGNVDPPQELLEGPPASHKDAARRFFVAQAKDYNKGEIPLSGPLPTAHQGQVRFDERTGRPLQVPHGSLFLGGSEYKPMALPIFDNAAGGAIQVEGLPSMPPMQAPITGQEDDEGDAAVKEAARRRAWVKRAFLHAWEGYKCVFWSVSPPPVADVAASAGATHGEATSSSLCLRARRTTTMDGEPPLSMRVSSLAALARRVADKPSSRHAPDAQHDARLQPRPRACAQG